MIPGPGESRATLSLISAFLAYLAVAAFSLKRGGVDASSSTCAAAGPGSVSRPSIAVVLEDLEDRMDWVQESLTLARAGDAGNIACQLEALQARLKAAVR